MISKKRRVQPVDSDVPVDALPEAPRQGFSLFDGRFLEYDKTMKAHRAFIAAMDAAVANPALLDLPEVLPESLDHHRYAALYLYAITKPARAGTDLESVSPVDLFDLGRIEDMQQIICQSIKFMREAFPDPKFLAELGIG